MTLAYPTIEMDTRTRVIVTAEKLFREIGYQKTTVADIAKMLKMSPANVYRFFDSKKAIHEAVANRLMGEVEAAVEKIAHEALQPKDRLREMLTTIHHMNSERYIGDNKLHEMVAIAMEENWHACEAHIHRIQAQIGVVVADGMASGDFKPGDAAIVAKCVCAAMTRFFHPQLIAECSNDPEPTLARMIDFVLDSVCVRSAVSH
jgi:AcrR family transcriptional regulator